MIYKQLKEYFVMKPFGYAHDAKLLIFPVVAVRDFDECAFLAPPFYDAVEGFGIEAEGVGEPCGCGPVEFLGKGFEDGAVEECGCGFVAGGCSGAAGQFPVDCGTVL